MPHPLLPVLDQIDPDATYTTLDLVRLLGLRRSTVLSLCAGGWLPGGQARPHVRGGRQWEWTGAALLVAASLSEDDLPELDHALYAPTTLYRLGCGCSSCTATHAAKSAAWKRRQADAAFPAAARAELLAAVATGTPVEEAAEAVGVSTARVWGYYRMWREFAAALDEAGQGLCVDATDSRCGSGTGYTVLRCRGTACRIAKRATRGGVSP